MDLIGYYGPINGYSYKNKGDISNDTRLWAGTVAHSTDGNVPTGYIGVKSRLYKSDALCKSTDFIYNTSRAAGLSNSTSGDCGSGTYYSKGVSAAYNGNGYDTYNTFQSPNIQY